MKRLTVVLSTFILLCLLFNTVHSEDDHTTAPPPTTVTPAPTIATAAPTTLAPTTAAAGKAGAGGAGNAQPIASSGNNNNNGGDNGTNLVLYLGIGAGVIGVITIVLVVVAFGVCKKSQVREKEKENLKSSTIVSLLERNAKVKLPKIHRKGDSVRLTSTVEEKGSNA